MQMDPHADGAVRTWRHDGTALLPPLAYTDPTLFRRELQRLFGRSWLYAAHESELRRGGDFKTTYLGLQPVIVTRDPTDGQFHILLNCCRHQRAIVCIEERGNTRVFRCGYHGWSYDNRGDLISVPDRRGNDERLLPPQAGLTRVPRVASYRGFLFASLSAEGESLTEHLGATRADLDRLAERHRPALQVQSPGRKVIYKANWKLIWEGQPAGGADAPLAAGAGRPIFPNLLLVGDELLVLRPITALQTEVTRYGVSNAPTEPPASSANPAEGWTQGTVTP